MARQLLPPELERSRRQDQFDPVVEGARYCLSREASLAIWERICTDETYRARRFDTVQAQQRFREVAARTAPRGGRQYADAGRVTRVQTEITGLPYGTSPVDELTTRTLGKMTLVAAETQPWIADDWLPDHSAPGDLARPLVPGRQTRVARMPSPRLRFEDYRVLGLQGVLQRLGPDHPLRADLVASATVADRAIAGRATRWREPLRATTSPNGHALWQAAERHAGTLYRHAMSGVFDEHDPAVESALQQRGAGQPLTTELRRDMEQALGIPLTGVRVHTDALAARAARALSAEAFTVGQDIFFSEGTFAPDTRSGRKLLTHELTHVAQALRGGMSSSPGRLSVSQPGEACEQEADAVAERIDDAAARPARVGPAGPDPELAPPGGQRLAPPPAVGLAASMPKLFRAPGPGRKGTPLQIDAPSFEGAAQGLADILQSNGFSDPARIIIVNGANVRVFDGTGKAVGSGKTYRLKTNALLPPGVFRMAGGSRSLHMMTSRSWCSRSANASTRRATSSRS